MGSAKEHFDSTLTGGKSDDKGPELHTPRIFDCLKAHGQLRDAEIAQYTGIELHEVRAALAELAAQGEISRCKVTRYKNGTPIEEFQCRLVGYPSEPYTAYGHVEGLERNRQVRSTLATS